MADDRAERQIRAALDRAGSSLEDVYETVTALDPSRLTIEAWQQASARIGLLLADFDRASKQVNRVFGLTSPQRRILTYLLSRLGERVQKEELRGVAAIYEWARRVRELRVEQGWPIQTRTQRPDLRTGEYLLESNEPDAQVAADWQLAKSMRNAPGLSGRERGLRYLKELSPRAADKDQLAYVMKIASWPRRLRELDEEGWRIVSNVDDPTLAPGTYRLQSLDQRPPRVRQAIKLRHEILERDGYRCKDDGRSPDNDGVTLQIHHLKFVSHGGGNEPQNLITLCSDCHAGRHALARGQAKDELLNPAWYEGAELE